MRAPANTLPILIALTALAVRPAASAVTGTLSPPYGSPLAVQTTQSDLFGGPSWGSQVNFSDQSQLEMAYAYVSGGALHVFISGNLPFYWNIEGQTTWLPLDMFIDCAPGGQHQLLANNPTLDPYAYDLKKMAGLTFDGGFEADYWLSLGANGGTWPNFQAYFAALPTGGGGGGAYLGSAQPGPPGVLSGGTNPYGIEVTFDDSNTQGIGTGCAAPALPAIQTGIEWAIPLAAIGNPTGCIRICAFVSCGDHSCISNQVMGPIPPGTCSTVPAASVDFSAIPGDQFFSVCPPTPARSASWGKLKTLYR